MLIIVSNYFSQKLSCTIYVDVSALMSRLKRETQAATNLETYFQTDGIIAAARALSASIRPAPTTSSCRRRRITANDWKKLWKKHLLRKDKKMRRRCHRSVWAAAAAVQPSADEAPALSS